MKKFIQLLILIFFGFVTFLLSGCAPSESVATPTPNIGTINGKVLISIDSKTGATITRGFGVTMDSGEEVNAFASENLLNIMKVGDRVVLEPANYEEFKWQVTEVNPTEMPTSGRLAADIKTPTHSTKAESPPTAGTSSEFIYAAIDEDGQATGSLIVANIGGEEIKQISLPVVEGKQFINLMPTRFEDIAIANRGLQENDSVGLFWVNTRSGEIKSLGVENYQYQTSALGRRRFEVFEYLGYQNEHYKLVDLQTGEAIDINALSDVFNVRLMGSEISADETHLVLYSNDGVWLIPTDKPQEYQQITSSYYGYVFFSSDGKKVFYTIKEGDDFNLNVFTIAEQNSKQVMTYSEYISIMGVLPDEDNQIIVRRRDSLSILNVKSGEEQELLQGYVSDIVISSSGQKILAHELGENSYLIDLDTLEVLPLDALKKMSLIRSDGVERSEWSYFQDNFISLTQLKALNLETGKVQNVLNLEDAITQMFQIFPADDASKSLMTGINEKYEMVAWAVNCDKGLVVELGGGEDPYSNAFSLGGISASGEYGIYSVQKRNEPPMVMIIDMHTGESRSLMPGLHPVWLVK